MRLSHSAIGLTYSRCSATRIGPSPLPAHEAGTSCSACSVNLDQPTWRRDVDRKAHDAYFKPRLREKSEEEDSWQSRNQYCSVADLPTLTVLFSCTCYARQLACQPYTEWPHIQQLQPCPHHPLTHQKVIKRSWTGQAKHNFPALLTASLTTKRVLVASFGYELILCRPRVPKPL